MFKLFCLAFGFGFGWDALVIEGQAWAGSIKRGRTAPDSSAGGRTAGVE